MASSTFATSQLNLLFERQYDKFIDQLNYGFEVLDHVQRKKAEFDGEYFYYPVTVVRSGRGRYQGEGQNQPTPHGVEAETIRFSPTEYIDKISFTWRFLAQSNSKRLHFKLAQRIEQVIRENREFCDQVAIFGNATRGFGCERHAAAITTTHDTSNYGAQYAGLFNVPVATAGAVLDYDGDHSRFAGCVTTDPSTWVPVDVRLGDNYDLVASGNGITLNTATAAELYVIASSQSDGTITIVLVANANDATLEINSAIINDGYAWSVELADHTSVGGISLGNRQFGAATPGDAQYEMEGIFSNLAKGTFGNVDRSNATYASLRSTLLTMGTSGLHPRAEFTSSRLQAWLDNILVLGGGEPTAFWMSPLMRSRYVAAVTTVLSNSANRYKSVNDGKGDIGVKTLEYAGYAMRTALNMPKGLVVGLNDDTWLMLTVGGNLMDFRRQGNTEDGPLFYDVEGTTTANAVLYGIHQLLCNRPNYGNGVICGITLG